MMKATPKLNKQCNKWVIDIETEEGEIIPVGHTIDEETGLWKVSRWDTKEKAEEWIKDKPKVLSLTY